MDWQTLQTPVASPFLVTLEMKKIHFDVADLAAAAVAAVAAAQTVPYTISAALLPNEAACSAMAPSSARTCRTNG